jgi:DNA-binding response OmpR family regulator
MKMNLLFAHRDANLCVVVRRFLAKKDYDVETSTDALDCVAKLRQVTPDVLVLDPELLWGGGEGVLAILCDESPTTTVKVLLSGTVATSPDRAGLDQSLLVKYCSTLDELIRVL